MRPIDPARAPRVLAVWVAVVVCSVSAHGMAGGRTEPATVVVLTILSAAAATGLGWRPLPVVVTAPGLAALQVVWHLVSCAVPATGRSVPDPVRGVGHHGHAAASAGGLPGPESSGAMGADAMTMPSPVWMTIAHLVAAALVMGALQYGERALRWLLGLGGRSRRLWVAVLRTTTPPSPRSRTGWTYVVVLRDEVYRRPALRRGPPAVEA